MDRFLFDFHQWHPAQCPFKGTPEEGLQNLISHGAPEKPLKNLLQMAERFTHHKSLPLDTCVIRDLRSHETIDIMNTCKGIKFHMEVPSKWPAGLSNQTLDCNDSLGNHLLKPFVCGNWSYEWTLPPKHHYPFYGENDYPFPPEGPADSGLTDLGQYIWFPGEIENQEKENLQSDIQSEIQSQIQIGSPSPSSIPEPSGILILIFVLFTLMFFQSKRRPR